MHTLALTGRRLSLSFSLRALAIKAVTGVHQVVINQLKHFFRPEPTLNGGENGAADRRRRRRRHRRRQRRRRRNWLLYTSINF